MSPEANQAALIIPPPAAQLMATRGIRPEDLAPVIAAAQAGGRFLRQRQGEHILAHGTSGDVTYWVEYSPAPQGCQIHTAYSHRMQVLEEPPEAGSPAGAEADWLCQPCGRALALGKVNVSYLHNLLPADLHRCPSCGQVMIPEDLAVGKMAEIEMLLEGK
ncbi:MAG: DVU_1557 family redox protein [Thermodesulfobacteriota bacterium]